MKIALIACVKEKVDYAAPAREMYRSSLFESWIKDALDIQKVDRYFIVSGKYGLLKPDEIIEPYDLNLNNQSESYKNEWSKKVLKRLSEFCDLEQDEFIIYTNSTYYTPVIEAVRHFDIPFDIN